MNEQPNPHFDILVSGDLTINWYLARQAAGCARLNGEYGGAALLTRLLSQVASNLAPGQQTSLAVSGPLLPELLPRPDDPTYHHSFTSWDRYSEGKTTAWRVDEIFGSTTCSAPTQDKALETLSAGLILVEDRNLGFRDQPERWPFAIKQQLRSQAQPWIVLDMAAPVAQGALWQALFDQHSERLVAVMKVDDLRHTEVQISRELSWERTAQDIFWELIHNPRLNALSRCAHTVITFGASGALLLSRQPGVNPTHTCKLIFDPEVIEGMWEAAHPGSLPASSTCLAAGLTVAVLQNPDQPDFIQGLNSGLSALRDLHLGGYQEIESVSADLQLGFPIERVAASLLNPAAKFAIVDVQDPVRFLKRPYPQGEEPPKEAFWTILHDRYKHDLNNLAEQIVLHGPETALQGVPIGRFGFLLTVDRREIEAFRSIRSLVAEYCSHLPQKRPLSIAVFGPPGSGKSFGVTQVASSLLPGRIQVLEFNLSQFDDIEALWDAMHQVRDVGLGGKIPLVFWDEFDTPLAGRPLGWLRYFLAPMQDGRFQHGQLTHPIGNAIFVFAGGTSATLELFGRDLDGPAFRAAKGPDFISRLKGYVDIKGPNRQVDGKEGEADPDPYYVIRRAILLHSILKRGVPELFEKMAGKPVLRIDPGVLRAFLQTSLYKHGVRSMESVIVMSMLSGKQSYERSCLPAEAQLNLHVDGQDFLSLVQQISLDEVTLEKLAMAAHEVFCEGLRARGYQWGPQTNDDLKTHASLVSYAELPEYQKEQNRATVRDILNKLSLAGYVMTPARSNEPPFNFPGNDLELLAELEHERWVNTLLGSGWQVGPETDKAHKIHRALVPWGELSEADKDKDRDLVRGIPDILARAGYAVQRSGRMSTSGG